MATGEAAVSTNQGAEELDKLKACHDEAYLYVTQALSYQESGENVLALRMYEQGIAKIREGMQVRCDRPYCIGPKWDDARTMQLKMQRTLSNCLENVTKLKARVNAPPQNLPVANGQGPAHQGASNGTIYPNERPSDPPPSYNEAMNHPVCDPTSPSKSRPPLLTQGSRGALANGYNSEEAEILFTIPEGVQMFFVTPDGYVTAPSYPSSLHIYKFLESARRPAHLPQCWLQIDSWIYPLHPDSSPALHTDYGAYMFPDPTAQVPGCSVGVILPSHAGALAEVFEAILSHYTTYKCEKEEDRLSHRISQHLVTGAEVIADGLSKGAEITNVLINKGASLLRQHMTPETEPYRVDPKVRKGIKIAQATSSTVFKVSSYLVGKLGDLTLALAQQVGPHVKHHTSKALANVLKTDEVDSQRKVDDFFNVAAGGLTGLSTIFIGLEEAAKSLAFNLSQETVQVVQHKYGCEASEVTGDALATIGNVALAGNNIRNLGPKAIAKRTAKDTGRVVLSEYVERQTNGAAASGEKQADSLPSKKKMNLEKSSTSENTTDKKDSEKNGLP
ncbi:SPG20 [Cordylochernes scorpioides]|uniref:SPG20 n=1 Tax=Cordylochernes scorpioides TaxID=51811 RepID=A0ABY6K9B8_9ARAC|nr:SPG20 [Cordylochernes scorpioides]